MELGISLPQFGAHAQYADRVGWFAERAEQSGVHSLWVAERLIAPAQPSVPYPGTSGIPKQYRQRLDPFALLSVAAAHTGRVRLGSNVLVSPLYPPAFLARILTTIDLVSAGRLLAGFGIGWSPEEYAAMGVPFEQRGNRLDESLDALETLWTQSTAEYAGQLWTVPATREELRPAQRPHPPVYLSAFGDAALDRVANRADGWLPMVTDAEPDTIRLLRERRERIDEQARAAGRDPARIETVLRINPPASADLDTVIALTGGLLDGTGIEHVLVNLQSVTGEPEQTLGHAEKLLAALR
ncbi:TIGR03619 family F420-dependent LLM class oxidoreductase [Sciscionella marina]|uniref:TIGR03619 family F420-dependent LLM class oxidoreductase n=1 Tax=Sciscionella marina TaxID=508770 RepID=UPI0003709A07|nr:TIGR03619 family F420-dependent LLM class oxidoreductase [Sciscionella marina]